MAVQKWSPRIWIARLGDEPQFSEDIDFLREQAPPADPAPDVVLDLTAVTHLNSSNLSQLLRLRRAMLDANARLRLVGPSDSTRKLFVTTGLDNLFDFQVDTTTALAELQMGSE